MKSEMCFLFVNMSIFNDLVVMEKEESVQLPPVKKQRKERQKGRS